MDKFFWAFFHSIMLIVLLTILGVAEIIKFGNDISKKMKSSNYKTCKLNTEKTLVAAIMCGDIFVLITIIMDQKRCLYVLVHVNRMFYIL